MQENSESVDEVDGSSFSSCIKNSTNENEISIHPNFRGEKYGEYYDMNFKHNGYLIIFSHSNYANPEIPSRDAANLDVNMLVKTFSKLNFKIRVCPNHTLLEIRNIIKELSQKDFKNYSTLAFCVSSHGNIENLVYAYDRAFDPIEELIDPFKSNPSLHGKPKMIFIEACRGKQIDDGINLVEYDGDLLDEFRIPTEADVLTVYATVPGYIAYHNDQLGSEFFIYLTETLEKYVKKHDFLTILTLTNHKISIQFATQNYEKPKYHNKKQCMSVMHTLTRKIKFKV